MKIIYIKGYWFGSACVVIRNLDPHWASSRFESKRPPIIQASADLDPLHGIHQQKLRLNSLD